MNPVVASGGIAIVLFVANFSAQLYFKWVPDVESQKRHMKQLAQWAFDILVPAAQVFTIYLLANTKEPVTPGFVVRVSLFAGLATITVVFTLFRRYMASGRVWDFCEALAKTSDQYGEDILWLSRFAKKHVEETDRHRLAITQMLKAQKLPDEVVESIRQILNGPDKTEEIKPASLATESDKNLKSTPGATGK